MVSFRHDLRGDVHFTANGHQRAVFYRRIPTIGSVWAMIDVHRDKKKVRAMGE